MYGLYKNHHDVALCSLLVKSIPINVNSFSSNLTKRSFSTNSFENLSCKSYNIVYAIECTLCGLIYVGETKGELRKRMNGHRSQINKGGNQLLYRHFNLPDHSVLSMKFRILEKIYHPTNKPINSCTPFRRKREEYWIRQLGTAAPYGCNDHIDSIGNLTSPGCQSVNVLNLFDRTSRRHRSHGSRRYNKPEIHNVSFDGLLPFVNLQLGLHHIRTRLYFLPLKTLHVLYESTLTLHFTDVGSPEHRLHGIILDISSNRLFKAVRVCDSIETKNRPFLKIKFANKGIDALNLSNILNQKSVQSNIPPYFEYKESPCISYSYTSSVATKIFNYKTSLQQIDFQSLSHSDGQADIFLYSYEAEFIQSLLSTGKKKLASQFNFTYRYIDDVLSINNPDFENYLGQMYPAELEIKDTTDSNTSASYLDLLLSIESYGQLRTSTRWKTTFKMASRPPLSHL